MINILIINVLIFMVLAKYLDSFFLCNRFVIGFIQIFVRYKFYLTK